MHQTYDKARNAVALALSPVVRALVDPDGALRDIRNLDSVRGCYFWSFSE
jgi:zeta-carotene desaturase